MMTKGFTFAQARDLWMFLTIPAFDYYGLPVVQMVRPPAAFYAPKGMPFLGYATIADTWFSDENGNGPLEYARQVTFNPAYLDDLYEDELAAIMWHEFAHCVSPYEYGHDYRWEEAARILTPYAANELFEPRDADPYVPFFTTSPYPTMGFTPQPMPIPDFL